MQHDWLAVGADTGWLVEIANYSRGSGDRRPMRFHIRGRRWERFYWESMGYRELELAAYGDLKGARSSNDGMI